MRTYAATRHGSTILFALAIVAVASMTAYAFTLSMRSANIVSRDLVVKGMAESAARMAARQVQEAVFQDYLADPTGVTSPFGPHHALFRDTNLYDPTWHPNYIATSSVYGLESKYQLHPFNTGVDNVPLQSKLFLPFNGVDGGQGQLYNQLSSRAQDERMTTGTARYIEPGRPGASERFSTLPATPGQSTWYDANWLPVSDPKRVRYRLRYAVESHDLGGLLLWGRQSPFSTTDIGTANPLEWDDTLARMYTPAFHRMQQAGLHLTFEDTLHQLMFLGRGTSLPADPWPSTGKYLNGFTATGDRVATNTTTVPGLVFVGSVWDTIFAAGLTGGPASWTGAYEAGGLGGSGDQFRWPWTPFGRASTEVEPPIGQPRPYYWSAARTPWRVNALSAPAKIHRMMIRAYLAPAVDTLMFGNANPNTLEGEFQNPVEGTPVRVDSSALGSSATNPVQQLQIANFTLPDGFQPFVGYTTPSYLSLPSTGNATAYPDAPDYWEDYAAVEAGLYSGTKALGASKTLGWYVNLFDQLGGDFPTTATDPESGAIMMKGWLNDPREGLRGTYGSYLFSDMSGVGSLGRPVPEDLKLKRPPVRTEPRGLFMNDTYWLDLGAAMGEAMIIAKLLYADAAAVGNDFKTVLPSPTPVGFNADLLDKPKSVKALDRLFLAMLGEHYLDGSPAVGSAPAGIAWGLYHRHRQLASEPDEFYKARWYGCDLVPFQVSNNIANVLASLKSRGVANSDRKAANMELVLNDMRMSFFGANPAYTDFYPYDFDGDGWVNCSAYDPPAGAPAHISAKANPRAAAAAAPGGRGPRPTRFFSLTGFYTLEKSHYWRTLSRGEVWDELLQRPIAEANLESAFAIDPEGAAWQNAQTPAPSPLKVVQGSTTLYHRWVANFFRGNMPLTQ